MIRISEQTIKSLVNDTHILLLEQIAEEFGLSLHPYKHLFDSEGYPVYGEIAKDKVLAELSDWSKVKFGTKILAKANGEDNVWEQAYFVGYLEAEAEGEINGGFYYTLSDAEDLFRTDVEPVLHEWSD